MRRFEFKELVDKQLKVTHIKGIGYNVKTTMTDVTPGHCCNYDWNLIVLIPNKNEAGEYENIFDEFCSESSYYHAARTFPVLRNGFFIKDVDELAKEITDEINKRYANVI